MKSIGWTLVIALLSLFAFLCPTAAAAKAPDFREWGRLAIQDGGRRKPFDTFARETLIRLSGRATLKAAGREWTPDDFVLSMALGSHDWRKEPLILVSYHPLAQKLGLDATARRFSFEQLAASAQLQALLKDAREMRQSGREQELTREQKEAEGVAGRLTLFAELESGHALKIFPPAKGDAWLPPGEGVGADEMGLLTAAAKAYGAGDALNFSVNAAKLRAELRRLHPAVYPSERMLRVEVFFNHLDPFDWAALCYGVALAILIFAHRSGGAWPRGLGLATATGGLLLHATGIALRCIIAGRPPVTNMYESVIWVSFGVMIFGSVFFLRYRTLTYLLAALPASLLCLLLVARMPVAMPGSIDPLVPVLRDNFWLTIHVLTITLSYAAFLLAMAFGHIVLWRYIRTPAQAEQDTELHFWLYRVLQLGILLLAAGTILGGVWANYSWGRFWGWDPKETWALIALLCYIFVLHGRIAQWWDHFGLAVASVVCFCAVLMTWYGVNFILGKGLHSYGFGIGGEGYVYTFVGLDLAFVAFAAFRHRRA